MTRTLKPSLRPVEDRNNLVVANLGLVRFMVGRLWRLPAVRRLGVDDAIQIGNLALLRAAELWDADKGFTFSTYACLCVVKVILRQAGIRHESRRSTRFWAGTLTVDGKLIEALMPPGSDLETWRDVDDRDELEKHLDSLKPRQREVIYLKYGEGKNMREVAEVLGVSRERARQIAYEAITRLRDRMGVKT